MEGEGRKGKKLEGREARRKKGEANGGKKEIGRGRQRRKEERDGGKRRPSSGSANPPGCERRRALCRGERVNENKVTAEFCLLVSAS